MAYNPEKIQEYAKVIFDRLNQFNDFTLATIARRIKNTGRLSAYDQQSLKNMADISGDMKAITKKLAEITKLNIDDLENVYSQTVSDGVNTYKPLYDFKNMPFVPFEQNDFAQQLVRHWARQTAGEMINLSRTKALCFDKYNINGEIIGSTPLQGAFQAAIDSAVTAVSSATTDFNTAMSKTIENLGGSGVRVNYASGVTRSLPAMIRQNLLYAVKQSAKAYDEYVGKQLNCDGFEVDAHPGCRPTHEVIQGQMYAYGYNDITIDGITYLSAKKDLGGGKSALELLNDYGCLHFTMSVILGVSEPRYSKEELAEIENQTKEPIEYEGRQKTLYQWKQTARRMERAVRKKQTQANMFKEAGNNIKAKDFQNEATAIRVKYNEMCEKVGLRPQLDRMQVHKNKSLTNGGNGGIIKSGAISGARNPYGEKAQKHAAQYYESVRAMTTDVAHIAKTTGYSEQEIQNIKNFIFYEEHNLGGVKPERFAPDFMMSESWQRLINGTPEPHDLTLIKHEIMEQQLIKQGFDQATAHIKTSEKYNYSKEARDFYGKIKKYKD